MSARATCAACAHSVPWRERVEAYAAMGGMPPRMPDRVCLANYKVPFPVFGGSTPEERGCDRFAARRVAEAAMEERARK